LKQQYELARIEEKRESVAINILDDAEPAVILAKPKRKLLIVAGLFFGVFLSIVFYIFRFSFSNDNTDE